MTQRRRALIVGGGVIGVTSAYYLSERNWDVTLIEKDSIGGGCSHGNCGLICPSDVLPLASPGAIRKTLAAMCRGRSPLYIKPRLTPRLWSWLLKFALRCNPRDMIRSAHGRMALLEPSMLMYQQLFDRLEIDCEWQHRGLLYVFQSLKGLDAYSSTDETLSDEFGLTAQRLESQELHSLDPSLKDSVAGAWYYQDDGHLRPDRLMSEWKRILTEAGVQIHENTEMQGLDVRQGSVVSAETSSGNFDADAVLVATGAVAAQMKRQIGVRLSIEPGKGYSITMSRPSICPEIPMLFPEHKIAVTPMNTGYRLGSTMEFSGFDTRINPKRINLIRKSAEVYMREPFGDELHEQWYGWRPMTYDGLPFIGPVPSIKNLFVAAGHNMLGLSMAPATGRLVAELMSDERPFIDPMPYRISR